MLFAGGVERLLGGDAFTPRRFLCSEGRGFLFGCRSASRIGRGLGLIRRGLHRPHGRFLRRKVQPGLLSGHYPERKEGHQIAEILRAVANELDA